MSITWPKKRFRGPGLELPEGLQAEGRHGQETHHPAAQPVGGDELACAAHHQSMVNRSRPDKDR